MIILGCDPGARGAVACLIMQAGDLRVFDVVDWPPLDDPRAGLECVSDLIHGASMAIGGLPPTWGFIERLSTLPHPFGKASAVTLGRHYEAARIALAGSVLNFRELNPKDWQAEVFRGERRPKASKDKKRQSLAKARALFPGAAELLSRAKDDGRAEALLIAEAGRRLMIGGGG